MPTITTVCVFYMSNWLSAIEWNCKLELHVQLAIHRWVELQAKIICSTGYLLLSGIASWNMSNWLSVTEWNCKLELYVQLAIHRWVELQAGIICPTGYPLLSGIASWNYMSNWLAAIEWNCKLELCVKVCTYCIYIYYLKNACLESILFL